MKFLGNLEVGEAADRKKQQFLAGAAKPEYRCATVKEEHGRTSGPDHRGFEGAYAQCAGKLLEAMADPPGGNGLKVAKIPLINRFKEQSIQVVANVEFVKANREEGLNFMHLDWAPRASIPA